MGIVAVKIKIMPSSPDTNLEDIKENSRKIIEENGGKNLKFEEEPVAFGLKAIISFFAFSEENSIEPVEEKLRSLEDVSSVQVIDMRRAFG